VTEQRPPVHIDSFPFRIAAPSNTSNFIRLANDRFITYDSVTLRFILPQEAALSSPGIAVSTQIGAPCHTTFQICFRFLYSAVELISLYQGFIRFFTWSQLTLEQQITVLMLVLAPLANNPLYAVHAFSPSIVVLLLEKLFASILHAYTLFAVAAFTGTSQPVTIPTIIGIVEFLSGIGGFPEPFVSILEISHRLFYLTFIVWQIYRVICGWRESDFARTLVYATGLLTLLVPAVVLVFGWYSSRGLAERTFEWVVTFCAHNGFVLMISYFHWPYDARKDARHEWGLAGHGEQTVVIEDPLAAQESSDGNNYCE
jgi:hypothetical protein